MQSTSCGSECPFVKNGMCKSCKECPNYIETWWYPSEENANPVKLEDCSPKRVILQQQVLQSKFDLTMQALVQSRNEYAQLCGYLKNLIEMSKAVVFKEEQKKEIQNEENIHLIADNSQPV